MLELWWMGRASFALYWGGVLGLSAWVELLLGLLCHHSVPTILHTPLFLERRFWLMLELWWMGRASFALYWGGVLGLLAWVELPLGCYAYPES
jgi:hypothetical protein